MKRVMVNLTQELGNFLKERARAEGRSQSNYLARLVERDRRNHEDPLNTIYSGSFGTVKVLAKQKATS